MKVTSDLPSIVFLTVITGDGESDREILRSLERLFREVMKLNEIVQLRKDIIDWREELLS